MDSVSSTAEKFCSVLEDGNLRLTCQLIQFLVRTIFLGGAVTSCCVFPHMAGRRRGRERVLYVSSYKRTNPITGALPSRSHLNNHSLKVPSPDTITVGVRASAHEFGEDYKRSRTQSTQQLYEIGPLVSPILQIRSQAKLRLSYWAKVMQPTWEIRAIVETDLQVFAYSTLWSSPLRHHLLQEAFQDIQTDSSPSCFCSIACIPVELELPGNLLPIPTPSGFQHLSLCCVSSHHACHKIDALPVSIQSMSPKPTFSSAIRTQTACRPARTNLWAGTWTTSSSSQAFQGENRLAFCCGWDARNPAQAHLSLWKYKSQRVLLPFEESLDSSFWK